MQAFAALQHAYSIVQRLNRDSLRAGISQPEAEQAAGSQHNRLLLQAYEIPHSCWHLLPPHLQAGADSIPCNTPFLAIPLDTETRQARSGPSATASAGEDEACERMTAAGAQTCVEESVLPWQQTISSKGCAQRVSSTPDSTDAAAAGPAGPAAIEASASLNISHEQRESVITGTGASLVADIAVQQTSTCCSAGTACGSVANSIDSDRPAVLAGIGQRPDTMNSAAGSACTAASGQTWEAGSAGISQVKGTDTLSHRSTVSTVSSCQGQGQTFGPSQGQGPGQGQSVVQMALLVPCRKAMKDRFPLNGTFFQVNEVFLDHNSTTQPLQVFPAVSYKTAER